MIHIHVGLPIGPRIRSRFLTGFGEAEAVHPLGEVVHAHVLRLAAVLEELLVEEKEETRENGFNLSAVAGVVPPRDVTAVRRETRVPA